MVRLREPPLIDVLPFVQFIYELGDNVLDYSEVETDLRLNVNGTLNWTYHCKYMLERINALLFYGAPVILYKTLT